MDGILAWGLDLIRAIQQIESPTLTAIMKGISLLGSTGFCFIMLSLIYWLVDRRRGARIALVFLASAFVNLWLKDVFGQPRPFELDKAVGLAVETSRGFPSGHAQGSLLFWGLVASFFPKPWGLVTAVVIPLLVGFSRVYLGLHFPTDVFAGWVIALVFLAADHLLGKRFKSLLPKLTTRWKLIFVAITAFCMNLLFRSDVSLAGAFLGAGFGFAWASESVSISTAGSFASRLARLLLGLAITLVVYIVPKLFAPTEGQALYDLVRFMRYAFIGAWVSFGAPWLFVKLRLAKAE
ncbi:MAG: phosphatase PAP2 family protein [Spirochaetota bacterium]